MLDTWEGGWDSGKPNVLLANLARNDERVARTAPEFAFYHTSDTHEVTKGSLGQLKFLHLTTVLSLRQGSIGDVKFAFYHSFERPKRTTEVISVVLIPMVDFHLWGELPSLGTVVYAQVLYTLGH